MTSSPPQQAANSLAGKLQAYVRSDTGAQFLRFIMIGGGSTLIDFMVYSLCLLAFEIRISKALGYLAGTAFSILVNYRWNFAYQGKDGHVVILKCGLLYAVALVINVTINNAALGVLGRTKLTLLIAFVLAVGVCTIFNFVGMKLWIFRRPASAPAG